jgi:hypothetical protein
MGKIFDHRERVNKWAKYFAIGESFKTQSQIEKKNPISQWKVEKPTTTSLKT